MNTQFLFINTDSQSPQCFQLMNIQQQFSFSGPALVCAAPLVGIQAFSQACFPHSWLCTCNENDVFPTRASLQSLEENDRVSTTSGETALQKIILCRLAQVAF